MDKWLSDRSQYSNIDSDENIEVFCNGIIIWKRQNNNCTDILEIAREVINGSLDFNDLYGFYKIVIFDKTQETYTFWGDNAGSQMFFYNDDTYFFSESFLKMKNSLTHFNPNYAAIKQLFCFGRVYTDDTLIEDIKCTDSEKYYTISNDGFVVKEKDLLPLYKNTGKSLDFIMDTLIDNIDKNKIGAVCTGGTDSRTILAHLAYRNIHPQLIITGHNDNPDILPAQKIAEVLNLPLTVQDPSDKSGEWIKRSFEFSDGIYDVVLAYRHLNKLKWAKEHNISFEFGGVGGEFYKNVFTRPFLDQLIFKKIDVYKAYDILFNKRCICPGFLGEKVKTSNEKDNIVAIIKDQAEKCKSNILNRVGMRYLQKGFGLICNDVAAYGCVKIDPLMDRNLIASVSKKSPLTLAMSIWQRNEIATHCPELSDIETDQGYSCTTQEIKLLRERMKKLSFYLSRVFARILKKMGLKYKSSEQKYWDADYRDAKASDLFSEAFACCKNMKIIDENVDQNDIEDKYVGNILLCGMLFSDKCEQ